MQAFDNVTRSLLELSDRAFGASRTEMIDRVAHAAMGLGDADGAALVLAHHRYCERVTLRRDGSATPVDETRRATSDFARAVLRGGTFISMGDVSEDARLGEDDRCPGVDCGPALFVPLRHNEHVFGYLALYRKRGSARFTVEESRTATLVAGWAAMALENRRLSESLKKLAVTDDLTQVFNFRYLKTALRRELRRAGRFHQELALVMIDVDNLKGYNDRNGHMRGSLLLRELAGLFAEQVRSFDVVAKYGGDEFTLILPQTDRPGGMAVAERMRAAVEAHAFPLAAAGSITVSSGVAMFPQDAEDPIRLIQAADRGLYLAKRNGRNRVETIEAREERKDAAVVLTPSPGH